jgi:hypothetical protein
MNQDVAIHAIIEDIKADKSIPAEYRNAVISTGRRWQCEIRGAKTMTNREPDGDAPATAVACTCPSGGIKRTCPEHGERA